jgi:hypothetical protein
MTAARVATDEAHRWRVSVHLVGGPVVGLVSASEPSASGNKEAGQAMPLGLAAEAEWP